MTTRIYVTSAEGGTGKSTIVIGLLDALNRSADRVGVFRPIARSEGADYILDLLLEHATAGLTAEESVGTTYEHLHDDPEGALSLIVDRFAAIEERCDVVVIVGSDYTDVGTPTELGMNGRIAADLAATVLLVIGGQSISRGAHTAREIVELTDGALAELAAQHSQVVAVIANRVDPDHVDEVAVALAKRMPPDVPSWVIPEDRTLVAPLLRTVFDAADATLVRGDPALLERPVMATVVAAMSLDNVLPRLIEGAVVVVPGDRSDVLVGTLVAQLSQTFPSLAGILLNGGFDIEPSIQKVIEGLSTTLPIARTDLGTFETVTALAGARSRLAADSPQKYAQALALFEKSVDAAALVARLSLSPATVMTPARFEHSLVERARASVKHIVLPEGDDDRILQAAAIVTRRGIAKLTILGDEATVRGRATELGLDLGADTRVIPTTDPELHARFAAEYARIRAHKGITLDMAADTVTDGSYFGTLMVHLGLADGMVSGAKHTTANTIRPGFEIVKTKPGVSVVSSVFLMALADRVLVYGDCAVIPEPTSEQLADIAISSAATARQFGIEPRVAMLSYSTGESGSGAEVDKVRAATKLVRERAPQLPVAGPIQYDAAADPATGASKMPGSDVAGRATVFVFPDLNTGNNTYKAVQRSSGAIAIGPVLQGLAKPVNDLSRGALVRDIVNTIAITAIQAQDEGSMVSTVSTSSTTGSTGSTGSSA